jgi:succinate dehydrogenase/fumarate reductase flavoprotein subunit/uncharacterized protein with FMN-binding domain
MKKTHRSFFGFAALLMAVMLIFTGCPQPEETTTQEFPRMTPGTYVATGIGFNGTEFPVVVTVSDSVITDIEIPNPFVDSANVGNVAAPILVQKIKKYQTSGVDNVSGASVTSMGIKSAVADALAQAGAPAVFTDPPKELAASDKYNASEDVDILIIGSGIAGLSAAVQAAKDTIPAFPPGGTTTNKKIVLIEKQEMIGGSTKTSAGVVYAALDDADKATLKDYYMMRSQGQAQEDIVEFWANNSIDTLTFLGISTAPGSPSGTSSKGRMRMSSGGNGIVQALANQATKAGVEIRTGIKAKELITNASGAVIGVKAESKTHNYTFNTVYTAPPSFFSPGGPVNGSVIIAAGGFDSDRDGYMKDYNSDSMNDIPQSNHGNVGEGIRMAEKIGAATVFRGGKVGWVGIDNSLGEASHYYAAIIKDDGEFLVSQGPEEGWGIDASGSLTAVTYETHADDYAVNHRRMLDWRKDHPDAKFWAITNSASTYKEPIAYTADTIAGLATKIGADSAKLEASFASGRGISTMFGPASTLTSSGTVFTATKAIPSSIGSMGGLKINTNAQVLKKSDDQPIPGLYAAGESANGQLFYLEYPGSGSSLSVSATFGRTAGAKAASRL